MSFRGTSPARFRSGVHVLSSTIYCLVRVSSGSLSLSSSLTCAVSVPHYHQSTAARRHTHEPSLEFFLSLPLSLVLSPFLMSIETQLHCARQMSFSFGGASGGFGAGLPACLPALAPPLLQIACVSAYHVCGVPQTEMQALVIMSMLLR